MLVVDKGVGLEVVLKTAEINVRRTASADTVIADKELGMVKAAAV